MMTPKPNQPYSLASMIHRGALFIAIALMSTAFIGCGFEDEERPFSALELEDDTTEVRIQELSGFCTVQVQNHGAVDVENDYIPNSIACENGNAPLEALKLQAIAARTYAKFITEAEKRPLQPSTRDQMYKCSYAKPKDIHFQAARETAGQVLTHKGKLIASFYVAGSLRSGATCGAGSDPTKTEKWVTYNQGRSGGAVKGTRLGSLSNPANRGAMSQNGTACWAKNGWKHDRMARYYYGDDIRIESLSGQCGGGSAPPPAADACNFGPSTAAQAPSCTSSGQAPNILPRSAWGAKAPRGYYSKHTPNRITIHHSVTSNTSTDSAALMRQIQNIHFGNGWNDFGYHFGITRDGKIFRGSAEDRLGTHVGNQNTGNLGIVLVGTYHQNTAPTDAQLKSAAQLVGHLAKKYKITINRTNIKGHGERAATLCPGKQVLSRFDKIIEWAKADSVCTNPGQTPADPNGKGDYRYVRVVSTSNSPTRQNDTIDGFEVDSIFFERADSKGKPTTHYAKAVKCSPGVSNPGAGIGKPDNMSCDDRKSTVAGVPVDATYIIELPSGLKANDVLFVTQNSYRTGLNDCEPSGTARISISQDGKVWKSVKKSVQGNSSTKITDAILKAAPEEDFTGGQGSFAFTAPKKGQWYTPNMTFTVSTSNPNIVKVKYLAEDDWNLGESTNRGNGFKVTYPYQYYGQRNSIAIGYDASGKEIARTSVGFTVTKKDGSIPGGKTDPGPTPSGQENTALANKLKTEGGKCKDWKGGAERCKNGLGGFSTGSCWAYVKGAMLRAGVKYDKLANAGPCSAYNFAMSAYGFGCNANANPATLQSIGLKKISVAPSKAPKGAIITYGKGCMGAHAVHGHIEVSMGNGVACSDYCGKIRGGNSSCASVFAPIK